MVKAPLRNSSNNSMPEEKLLTRKQSSGKKKNYLRQDIGEQLEKDSLVTFGELETLLCSVLTAGDSNGKVFTFLPIPGASPGAMLYFILATQGLLWSRDYFRNKKDQTNGPPTPVACFHHQLEIDTQGKG